VADVKSVLMVGVGGQGTILASKILTGGLLDTGYDVKMAEVHGMAQRGGSVSSQVRFGKKVYSPIICKGQADCLISFELMEALRWLEYLNPKGKAIINDYRIPSAPILSGKADYPNGIIDIIKNKVDTLMLNAAELADGLGNLKTMNIVMLGALIKNLKLTDINWEESIKKNVKSEMLSINLKAFYLGLNQK